ncbi:GlxA family transcriptional regulator [Chelativorans sp. M5D2P16]|uniref:GlxA family transcriptional regulator n=1 Tax=Chelativorans sp. M5D2P16 TaxID=3095678 RepID=UPI002ACA2FA2|nr:GlxA family transcriptional regulator [Chelativorans sp. M5D2P16]MDZ5696095.1 GlxA family transcriptional regulator [Chelativorans sp. M5D2P16]
MRDKTDNGASSRIVAEVALVIYPECQLSAVYGLTDLFRLAVTAAQMAGECEPPVIRVTHWQETDDGVACIYDSHPGEPHRVTYVITPPSLVMPNDLPSMRVLADWMMDHHGKGAILCSVCAGAFVLAETGLFEGREVTTHWAFADALSSRFPEVNVNADRIIVDDGDIITAGGILAWTDLGLTLVQRLLGASAMLHTARFLLIDPPRQAQRPYSSFIPKLDHGDAAIRSVQHWLQTHATAEWSVTTLADRAGLEERTFLRRFKAATGLRPTEYVQQIRIAKAREALELTRRPIELIAWEIGYGDPSAFRKLFNRITGLPPAEYRRRFGVALHPRNDLEVQA